MPVGGGESAQSLVVGASGFLGSHVVRELAGRGERVRVLVRPTSSMRALAGLDLDVRHGDVHDPESVLAAMRGVRDVYYCAVDTRAWLRDPAPLFATNVDALPGVLAAAQQAGVRRFVFTSSIATLAIADTRPVDESMPHNWARAGGAYVASRVRAEALVLRAAREQGLPAVAMCVANTYGAGDLVPTPHGGMLFAATLGRMPFQVRGAGAEVVAVDDAARAMLLAAAHGRVGERYVVSERYLPMSDVLRIGAETGGVRPPRLEVPKVAIGAAGFVGEQWARVRGRDVALTRTTARLMHVMTPLDHGKAVRELGWEPRPATDAIREAAEDFLLRRAQRRSGQRSRRTADPGR